MGTNETKATEHRELKELTVPLVDMYGYKFPDVWINRSEFKAGQTYKVSPEIYDEVNLIIKKRQGHDARLMDPTVDLVAMNDLFGSGSTKKGTMQVYLFDPRTGTIVGGGHISRTDKLQTSS